MSLQIKRIISMTWITWISYSSREVICMKGNESKCASRTHSQVLAPRVLMPRTNDSLASSMLDSLLKVRSSGNDGSAKNVSILSQLTPDRALQHLLHERPEDIQAEQAKLIPGSSRSSWLILCQATLKTAISAAAGTWSERTTS